MKEKKECEESVAGDESMKKKRKFRSRPIAQTGFIFFLVALFGKKKRKILRSLIKYEMIEWH